jgi:hypothetical protein
VSSAPAQCRYLNGSGPWRVVAMTLRRHAGAIMWIPAPRPNNTPQIAMQKPSIKEYMAIASTQLRMATHIRHRPRELAGGYINHRTSTPIGQAASDAGGMPYYLIIASMRR